ncbi:MAG: heterodisulfide reductase-related iron-sulfur binding cluster, partial [Deltaproteobacteria bacterium]|nr:heterodisulfide reductase-related iron-sulfur binding cluster [Deltaproteobacteria bacterium]
EEKHSTRGRATAFRAVLSGKVPRSEFSGEGLHEVLDLCLECMGCKAECPSNVDMAKLKYEFLHHYQQVHGVSLRSRLFGRIGSLSRWGSVLAPVANRVNANPVSRWLLDRLLGIDRRRPLPSFARHNFDDWWKKHAATGNGSRGSVILFHDTFNTYSTPDVAVAATRLLEHCGYRVMTVRRRCCGRPMISKGMLQEAKDNAAWNVARLLPHVEQGVRVVGLEPSCILTLRDEYPDLLRNEPARLVAGQTLLIEELLARDGVADSLTNGGAPRAPVLLHGHCHQKALVGMAPTVSVLRDAGHEVREVDSGCCGMAGSFGFEKEHYDVSVTIANRRLVPAVETAPEDARVVASGISCRQQIEHLTGRRALHPVEVLWEDAREAGA